MCKKKKKLGQFLSLSAYELPRSVEWFICCELLNCFTDLWITLYYRPPEWVLCCCSFSGVHLLLYYQILLVRRDSSGRVSLSVVPISSGVPRGSGLGGGGFKLPPSEIPKALQNRAKLNPTVKTFKNCWIWDAYTPKIFEKKRASKIVKLPPVRNCFTLAMTNKLVVIINSLKVPTIKKNFYYMKRNFLYQITAASRTPD